MQRRDHQKIVGKHHIILKLKPTMLVNKVDIHK
jgi:hypothetical protein